MAEMGTFEKKSGKINKFVVLRLVSYACIK